MELRLHPTLPSQIVAGPRGASATAPLTDQSQAETVLVAVVKATIAADDPTATPLPAGQQQPVRQTDVLFDDGAPQDAANPMRFENDLAAFKPRADVVVLGSPAPPQPGPIGGFWVERVSIGTDTMVAQFSAAGLVTFGWQDRREGARFGYAGDALHFDPAAMRLPVGFRNLFFNGGSYRPVNGLQQPAFAHPAPGARVDVETRGIYPDGSGTTTRSVVRRLHLPSATPRAALTYRTGPTRDAPITVRDLPMATDTIVFDKAAGHFSVVWRSVWPLASVPLDRYVSLVLS